MNPYLSGERLYGDDLSPTEIAQWFRDEADGCCALLNHTRGSYDHHALNWHHGFRHLPNRRFARVLGIGSAYGDELNPILDRCGDVTILEPVSNFRDERFRYVEPDPSGRMPFGDQSFDLITCFGVLHHIPNVSTVISEISRCIAPGGWLLLREPVISMGDWNLPRRGLTKHERGIPPKLLHAMLANCGLTAFREARCWFPLTQRLSAHPYDSPTLVRVDALLCLLPWPFWYHADHWWKKFRASSIYMVLTHA
ncbi:MAG: class I SAM-dependent methyltransferase [Acidobacteriia bacterium]|nr:class I SAM-dependent methyltransferase [Terriglobia bacterium]